MKKLIAVLILLVVIFAGFLGYIGNTQYQERMAANKYELSSYENELMKLVEDTLINDAAKENVDVIKSVYELARKGKVVSWNDKLAHIAYANYNIIVKYEVFEAITGLRIQIDYYESKINNTSLFEKLLPNYKEMSKESKYISFGLLGLILIVTIYAVLVRYSTWGLEIAQLISVFIGCYITFSIVSFDYVNSLYEMGYPADYCYGYGVAIINLMIVSLLSAIIVGVYSVITILIKDSHKPILDANDGNVENNLINNN